MKLKNLGLAAIAAMTLTALAAGSASATTLEVGGVTKNETAAVTMSVATGTSVVASTTAGELPNTCTESDAKANTASPFTGTSVTAPVATLTYSKCTRPITVHKPGTLHISHTSGTAGTVKISGVQWTFGSPLGTITCSSSGEIHLGTLTGTKEGHATLDVNAVLSCGFALPSLALKGTYVVTSPTGLGVSA